MAIERAFGLLKGRFRSLLIKLAMDRTDLIPMHILARCVLHNVCCMRDDLNIKMYEDVEAIDCVMNNENMRDVAYAGGQVAKRELIAERLQMRYV